MSDAQQDLCLLLDGSVLQHRDKPAVHVVYGESSTFWSKFSPHSTESTKSTSHGELHAFAMGVSKVLRQLGSRVVGVYCLPSLEWVVAVIGLLMADCVYLPVSPDMSELRKREILAGL